MDDDAATSMTWTDPTNTDTPPWSDPVPYDPNKTEFPPAASDTSSGSSQDTATSPYLNTTNPDTEQLKKIAPEDAVNTANPDTDQLKQIAPEDATTPAISQQSGGLPSMTAQPTPLAKGQLDDPQFAPSVAPETNTNTPTPAPAAGDAKITDINTGWHFGQMSSVKGMIIHHTGGRGDVDGVISTLNQRHLGVQFVVDREGQIFRLAPEGSKAPHMKNGWGDMGRGRSNDNMQGVEVIANDNKDVLPVQVAAVQRLVAAQSQRYGYDPKTNVFGHGEVNPGHKEADEGMSSVSVIRGGAAAPTQTAQINVPSDVMSVLRRAADVVPGTDVNRLASIAKQESGFNPNSSNGTHTGLFSFDKPTWDFAMKQWGDIHGIASTAKPTDTYANAVLGAEYLRYGQQQIAKATGRVKPGEDYLTLFLGPTGGSNFVRLAQANPNANAADYFPKAAAANRSIFYNKDGSARSVQDVYDWGVKIGGGTPGSAATPVQTVRLPDADPRKAGADAAPAQPQIAQVAPQATGPQAVATGTNANGPGAPPALGAGGTLSAQSIPPIKTPQQTVAEEDHQAKLENDASYLSLIGDNFSLDNTLGIALGYQHFNPNPQTLPEYDATVKKWQSAGIPDSIIQRDLPQAISGQHEQWLFNRAQTETDQANQLAGLGFSGAALSLAQNLVTDPVALGAGMLSGGVADAAVAARGLGMAARYGAQAFGGMAANSALAGIQYGLGNSTALDNPAMILASGAAFGALGGIGRNPFAAHEAGMIAHAAEGEAADMAGLAHENSVGAAETVSPERQFLDDKAVLAHPGAPDTAMAAARMDMNAWSSEAKSGLKTSGIYGRALFADAIGPKDKELVNSFTVDQDKTKLFDTNNEKALSFVRPAFDEWMKENGHVRAMGEMYKSKFGDQVYDVGNGIVERDAYGPAVARVVDKYRDLYANDARDLQNVWRKEGLAGRPLEGFENGSPIEGYIGPRVTDYRKASDLINKGGNNAIKALYEKGLRSGMADWGVSNDAIEDIAHNIAGNSQSRANGVWENFERAMNGDKQGLFDTLREAGVKQSTLDELTAKYPEADKLPMKAASDARTKHRLPIDMSVKVEGFKMKDGTTRDLTFRDLMISDPTQQYMMYNNWKSGRMAMMRMRIRNPETGELLVDGIHNQADWDNKVIANLKKEGVEKNIGDAKLKGIIDMFNFAHDRILGRPNPAQQTTYARIMRRVRDYNVVRMLGRLGFTHTTQLMLATGSLGFKAVLSQVPSLRTIIQNGDRVSSNRLMREILAFTGNDGTAFHMFTNMHLDDYGWAPGHNAVDGALNVGKQWMSNVSGFNFVNKILMQGTQRAIAQRISDIATKVFKNGEYDLSRLSKGDLSRLRSIGLGEDTLKKVLTEMTTHREVSESAMQLFGQKLHALNLHKWGDLEARAAFEQSLFTWSRRLILHNDLGNMAKWMSSPTAQAIMQFRSFITNAWAKVSLYNLHQLDMRSFTTATYSMMMASAMYALRETTGAVGRSDANEYLSKKLTPGEIVKGAMQMTPLTSILPMLIDTPLWLSGYQEAFDARSTGQATSPLLGSPVVSLPSDLQSAFAALVQPMAQGYTRSQPEYRSMARMLPFSNTVPFNTALSAMISSAPPKTFHVPKAQKKLF